MSLPPEDIPEYSEVPNLPPPIYLRKRSQKFPVVNGYPNSNLTVYSSTQSERDYRGNKKKDQHVLSHQADGYGMPLLEARKSVFSASYFTIRQFTLPPKSQHGIARPFNKNSHFKEYCTVVKNGFTYALKYSNKDDIKVIGHEHLPIIDYLLDGVVFRWIHEYNLLLGGFKYILLKLGPERGYSLVDEQKVGKSVFSAKMKLAREGYFQDSTQIGEIRGSMHRGTLRTSIHLENILSDDYDTILSVSESMLVHLAVGLILKRHQDKLEKERLD